MSISFYRSVVLKGLSQQGILRPTKAVLLSHQQIVLPLILNHSVFKESDQI